MAAHQALPSLGFSWQEHWSGLPFPSPVHEKWKVKVKLLSRVRLLATPWTAVWQAPPSMGFSRQEYWSGVPLPSPASANFSNFPWFWSCWHFGVVRYFAEFLVCLMFFLDRSHGTGGERVKTSGTIHEDHIKSTCSQHPFSLRMLTLIPWLKFSHYQVFPLPNFHTIDFVRKLPSQKTSQSDHTDHSLV